MLHQIDGILVSQRHKVEILFSSKLISLVEDVITYLTISVEIVSDNIGVTFAEAANNLLVR